MRLLIRIKKSKIIDVQLNFNKYNYFQWIKKYEL